MSHCYILEEEFNIEVACCVDCHQHSIDGNEDLYLSATLKDGRDLDICGPMAKKLVAIGVMDVGQLNRFNRSCINDS